MDYRSTSFLLSCEIKLSVKLCQWHPGVNPTFICLWRTGTYLKKIYLEKIHNVVKRCFQSSLFSVGGLGKASAAYAPTCLLFKVLGRSAFQLTLLPPNAKIYIFSNHHLISTTVWFRFSLNNNFFLYDFLLFCASSTVSSGIPYSFVDWWNSVKCQVKRHMSTCGEKKQNKNSHLDRISSQNVTWPYAVWGFEGKHPPLWAN